MSQQLGVARTIHLDSTGCTYLKSGVYTWEYPKGVILGPPGSTVKCYLLHAQFYSTTFNIPTGSTLCATIDGTTTTATLSLGQYDVSSLITAVESAFPSLTVVFDTASGRFTITSSYAFTIRVTNSTVLSQLGLSTTSDSTATLSSGTYTLVAPNLASLGGSRFLAIKTNLRSLNVENQDSESGGSLLARVPISQFFGELVAFNNPTGSYSTILDHMIHRLEIKMTDSDGALVDFGGTAWSISLFFEAIPDPNHLTLLEQYDLKEKNVTVDENTTSSSSLPPRTD